jgi:hypothetical protein
MGKYDNGCSKTILVLINSLFLLLGLGILALGIYIKLDPSYSAIFKLLNSSAADSSNFINLEAASIVIIIIGAITTGISIIGILGACFEFKPLIILYGIVITLILLALLAIGISALVFKYALRRDFEEEFKKTLIGQLKKDYQGEISVKNAFTITVDVFQIYFKCCGVLNSKDFDGGIWNTTSGTATPLKTPISCCKFNDQQRADVLKGIFPKADDIQCATNPQAANSNFDVGCLTEMNIYLDRILLVILLVTIIVGFILIIGSVSSCCMCRSFN